MVAVGMNARVLPGVGSCAHGENGGLDVRRGVVGVDGSPASLRALAFACGWAQRTGSALVVTYVETVSWQYGVDCYAAAAMTSLAADTAAWLPGQLVAYMGDVSCAWSLCVCAGVYPDRLEQVAADYHSDAIIVGRSRRRWLRRSACARLSRISQRIIIAVP